MSHSKKIICLSLAVAALVVSSCRSPDIYDWGNYEQLIYASYTKPDKATPELQAQVMEEDMNDAASDNKPLPPGFHAHLGYLYYQMGKLDLAAGEFKKEKEQFPESAVFMDRLIANLNRK
jgi:hypothetical protein